MLQILKLIFLAHLAIQNGDGQLYTECLEVTPTEDFRMDKMVGFWYSIKRTIWAPNCVIHKIEKSTRKNDLYKISMIMPPGTVNLPGYGELENFDVHPETLTRSSDPTTPAKMNIRSVTEYVGRTIIFASTDYENYAIVYIYKKINDLCDWSVEILSRKPALEDNSLTEVNSLLDTYNIAPTTFFTIKQRNCTRPRSLVE